MPSMLPSGNTPGQRGGGLTDRARATGRPTYRPWTIPTAPFARCTFSPWQQLQVPYIVAGARTPIGKMSGALASFSAADLGGLAIKAAALERAGVAPDEVDHVIMGQVLMAGQGQVPSRQAAVKAGIPMNVPSVNVNKVCLSGLNSIYLANQMIAAGEADIVVAGGMESMTNAPYLADGCARRVPLRQHRTARRDHRRRAVVRVRRLPDGPRHRSVHR